MQLPDIAQSCESLAADLASLLQTRQIDNPLVIGVRTGGVWVAEKLHQSLSLPEQVYSIDISFYRDDFTRHGLHPEVRGSELPDTIEDRHVILVDDVIMSGRTVRAALNELFDYGRPASVTLACLYDIGRRELPIQPDVCGEQLHLEEGQLIKLTGPEPLAISLL